MTPLLHLLASSLPLFIATITLLGLMVGSFLNVVIYRLPKMLEREWRSQCRQLLFPDEPIEPEQPTHFNLITPASHCPSCGHPIRSFENIPLVSYLLQRGRCRHCGVAISRRYPLIELTTALLSGIVAWQIGYHPTLLPLLLLTWTLIALTVIDLDRQLLPDQLTLPLLWLALLLPLMAPSSALTDLAGAVVGAALGYLALWSVYWLFKLTTGKEGMGYGDFKLLAALGAWLGWSQLPLLIILSALTGTLVGVYLMLFRHHQRSQPIPFGPYLALAGWIGALWGEPITHAYLQWITH